MAFVSLGLCEWEALVRRVIKSDCGKQTGPDHKVWEAITCQVGRRHNDGGKKAQQYPKNSPINQRGLFFTMRGYHLGSHQHLLVLGGFVIMWGLTFRFSLNISVAYKEKSCRRLHMKYKCERLAINILLCDINKHTVTLSHELSKSTVMVTAQTSTLRLSPCQVVLWSGVHLWSHSHMAMPSFTAARSPTPRLHPRPLPSHPRALLLNSKLVPHALIRYNGGLLFWGQVWCTVRGLA